MILFLDTSALVKLYVDEANSADVGNWVSRADEIACQWLAYVEARAAFAVKHRLGDLTEAELTECRQAFEEDWERIHRVTATEPLLRQAGAISERFGLRAYDSVHLAGAEQLQTALGSRITFASFDNRQIDAARQLDLLVA